MKFLPDVYVPCEVCQGKRYNREALEINYKGKSIADVLDMTVTEALDVLREHPGDQEQAADARRRRPRLHPARVSRRRSSPAARRSASSWPSELSRRATGRTIYILDEPTTGLHFADIERCSASSSAWPTAATRSS